jgi:excisionase family DNA binding protein
LLERILAKRQSKKSQRTLENRKVTTDKPIPEDGERYLTIQQVAKIFGVVTKTVRNWIDAGDLEAFQRDRFYRITREAVNRFLKKHKAKPRRRSRSKKSSGKQ